MMAISLDKVIFLVSPVSVTLMVVVDLSCMVVVHLIVDLH
jgi:hypothetical protein